MGRVGKKFVFFGLLVLSIGIPQAFAISVIPENDPFVLTNAILGTGIVITSGPTYTGAITAAGTFSDGLASGIGLEDGIVLTSGSVLVIDNLNDSDTNGVNNLLAGDADLDAIVTPNSTFDASLLEFEFTTESGNVEFQYVFASEEYNEFVNTGFNDVFALFVDGVNVALLPGGSTPVAIDTVNNGNPEPGFDPTPNNPEFYNDNDILNNGVAFPPTFPFEYDGFTNVLTATVIGLATDTSHTMKFVIADTGDFVFDSGVFIKGESFSDAVCGNGELEDGEQCDDGNKENGDGCSATCEIEPVTCGPFSPANGPIDQCDNTPEGETCPVECDPGFEPETSPLTCQEDGNFNAAANCVPIPVTCGPFSPANGPIDQCDNTPEGETCPVECDPGFEPETSPLTCQEDGNFNAAANCVPIPVTCGPFSPANGPIDQCDNTPEGETCPVECDPGFEPETSPLTCQEDGNFNAAAACTAIPPPPEDVIIDIKPGSEINPINTKAKGVIPVAILGSDTLDVLDVDPTTLEFGPFGAGIAHKKVHYEDVNEDGILDLVAHFKTQETGIANGDTEAFLSGAFLDGEPFLASDVIRTVPKD